MPKQLLLPVARAAALLAMPLSERGTPDSALEPLCLTTRAGISIPLSFLKRPAILVLTSSSVVLMLGGSCGRQLRLQSHLKPLLNVCHHTELWWKWKIFLPAYHHHHIGVTASFYSSQVPEQKYSMSRSILLTKPAISIW